MKRGTEYFTAFDFLPAPLFFSQNSAVAQRDTGEERHSLTL